MRSGVNIDCRFIINVKKIMEYTNLPSPRLRRPTPKALRDSEGTIVPIILVECEV